MTEEIQAHKTTLSMVNPALTELHAGSDIALKVKVSCPSACDLRGKIVKIIAQDAAVVKEVKLTQFYGTVNETDQFIVKTPVELGAYTWNAVFPAQEEQGVLHQESSVPFPFVVKQHAISVAVWDLPSPVAFGDKFRIKVGVKCSAECKLTGREIEIYDQRGAKVATGALGDVPWLDTSALYWTEVELEGPSTEGIYTWTVKFPKPDLERPHEETAYTFGFRTARQPEHMVTVEVIDKDTMTPIRNAHVLLHPYSGYTDKRGVARLRVPKGEYKLCISASDKMTFQATAKVAGDVATKAELLAAPVLTQDDSG